MDEKINTQQVNENESPANNFHWNFDDSGDSYGTNPFLSGSKNFMPADVEPEIEA
jgi:hypothetical protein